MIEESERCRTDRAERRLSSMARSVSWEVDDMRYRFFSIPAMMPDDMQDEMNRFCAAHRVISIEKQFVQDGERSYSALSVFVKSKIERIAQMAIHCVQPISQQMDRPIR